MDAPRGGAAEEGAMENSGARRARGGAAADALCCPAHLTEADFAAMAALEAACYGADYITPAAEAYAWYRRDARSTVAAVDASGALAGFVNLLAVRPEIHRALLLGAFNDSALTADGLAPPGAPGGPFLSCIAVRPEWRGSGLSLALLRRAAAAYPEWPPDALIAADNVTAAGERLSRRCGLTLRCVSDHGSRVYAGPWSAFCAAVGLAAAR